MIIRFTHASVLDQLLTASCYQLAEAVVSGFPFSESSQVQQRKEVTCRVKGDALYHLITNKTC